MRTLLVDNYDSYSYNVFQLMAATFGAEPTVLANDAPEWADLDLSEYDAVVISPGPGRPEVPADRGVALDHLRTGTIPVLGVCLGHQALGWLSGGTVVTAPEPRHGYLESIRHTGTELFRGVPQDFTAVRYHSLCVAEPLPEDLEATAWSPDGVVMGLRHRRLPWWGVQFHPESVASEHGAAIFANFAELVRAGGSATELRPSARTVRRRVLDFTAPTEILFEELFAGSRFAFWLDSSRIERGLSRFSFLGDAGGELGEVLSARVGTGIVNVVTEDGVRSAPGSIFDTLEERLHTNRVPWDSSVPFDLACGYVGYFGYEMRAECGSPTGHTSAQPDAQWMSASRMVAVDHETGRTWVLALADGSDGSVRRAQRWVDETAERVRALRDVEPRPVLHLEREIDVEPYLHRPRDRYLADIEACMASLHAGASYEICLTNGVELPFAGSAWEAYRWLRRRSPAPYAAYLRFDDLHVVCSSPERFLTIDAQGTVESKPIKGTARRDPDPEVDRALRDELAGSAKTRAENLMIVDLLRNDLGRICEIGSIRVPGFMKVESYATVHQLVSTIRGRLRRDVGPVAAVRAAFPGGSMTGAPKLRTMQIIDGLEERPRGIYSGALGFFGLQGAADLNIVIRTATIEAGRATIGAGGAIVLDSDPADEFDEMTLKASAVVQAVAGGSAAAAARPAPAPWGRSA
ncbi:aminodeoxychorismate synthase component I [Pseudonocardia xishanensis]|uniref:aminodeoxychorismate synthase n=1 Tax=Pseudonocardia xishanensis TaxID=630995 RepID=A0ABP8RZI0_9PSEU